MVLISKREESGFMSVAAAEAKLRNAADEVNVGEVPGCLQKCERRGDFVRCRDVDDEVTKLASAAGNRMIARLDAEIRERQAARAVLSKRGRLPSSSEIDKFLAVRKGLPIEQTWRIPVEEWLSWLAERQATRARRGPWATTDIRDLAPEETKEILVEAAKRVSAVIGEPTRERKIDWCRAVEKCADALAQERAASKLAKEQAPDPLAKAVVRDAQAASAITFPSARIKL